MAGSADKPYRQRIYRLSRVNDRFESAVHELPGDPLIGGEPVTLPRVAVVSDLREERWHAMDLVAEMLLVNLRTPGARLVDAMELRPAMVRRLSRLPLVGMTATARMRVMVCSERASPRRSDGAVSAASV